MPSSTQQRTRLGGIGLIYGTVGAFFHWREQYPHENPPSEREQRWGPQVLGRLVVPQQERKKEKENSKPRAFLGVDVRQKPQNESRYAQHGWMGGVQEATERSERMEENPSPAGERHETDGPTRCSQQQWRDEIKKGAIATVFFLNPFFLF